MSQQENCGRLRDLRTLSVLCHGVHLSAVNVGSLRLHEKYKIRIEADHMFASRWPSQSQACQGYSWQNSHAALTFSTMLFRPCLRTVQSYGSLLHSDHCLVKNTVTFRSTVISSRLGESRSDPSWFDPVSYQLDVGPRATEKHMPSNRSRDTHVAPLCYRM